MKKIFRLLAFLFALLPVLVFSQAPEGINYQTVLRDAQGNLVANTPVTLLFDIRDGSPLGNIIYSEKHITLTNALGIVNLPIGQGVASLGNFSAIDWSANQKFLQISADINNSGNPMPVGTIQFLSVPYALYAKTSGGTELSTDATLNGDGSNASPLKLAQQSATPGQVLKWNGITWAPQNDNGEIYTEGNGIDILGNVITNTGDTNVANDITSDSLAGGDLSGTFSNLQIKVNAVTANEIAPGAITTSELAAGAVTGDKIAPQGAMNGQVLQFNSATGTWAPATISGNDNWGTQVVKTDLTLSGDGTMGNLLKLAPQGAMNGQVLKFDGTTWKPQNDGFAGTLNGEVTGPLDNNTVVALKGRPIGGMGPQDGELFVFDNTILPNGAWKPAKLSGEVVGGWNGTTVAALKGRPIGGMGPQDGELFVFDNTILPNGAWKPAKLSGEVVGGWNGTTVAALKGRPIGGMGPQDGELFVFDNSILPNGAWKPAPLNGDVTGGWNSTLLSKIKGLPITGTPAASQVLALNSANTAYIYTDDGLKLPYNNVQNFGNVVMFNIDNTSANSGVGMQVTSTNETGIKGATRKGQTGAYSLSTLANFSFNFPAGVFGESTITGANEGIGVFGRSNDANDDFGMGGLFQGKEFGSAGIGGNLGTAGVFGFMGASQNAGVLGQVGTNGIAGVLGVGGDDNGMGTITTAGVYAIANGADNAGYFEGTGNEENGIFVFANGADFSIRMEGGNQSNPGGSFPGNIGNGASMFSRENESTWATFAMGDCFCGDVQVFTAPPVVQLDNPARPEEQLLTHSLMESPDMKTVYDGAVTTDEQGLAEVELPDYAESLNENFHYQLTVIGQFAQAIVKHKVKKGYFVIQTDKPYVEVHWQVTGVRKAQFATKSRPQVITEKPAEFKGKYYYPEFFGQPESKRAVSTSLTDDMDTKVQPKFPKE